MATVKIPEDRYSVLSSDHPAVSILSNSSIVIQRQMEMMNVFLGFEQANKYVIMDPEGNTIGYLAEQEHGIANMMARQLAKTHRSFTTHVFDKSEKEVLRVGRESKVKLAGRKTYNAPVPPSVLLDLVAYPCV